jgi:hypothetical protein
MKIFIWVFLSLPFQAGAERLKKQQIQGMSNQSLCNIELHSSNLKFCKIQAWGIDFHKYISCHVATLSWLSLPLRHAQFAKQQSSSFITV